MYCVRLVGLVWFGGLGVCVAGLLSVAGVCIAGLLVVVGFAG